jgi:hypothetical protein
MLNLPAVFADNTLNILKYLQRGREARKEAGRVR